MGKRDRTIGTAGRILKMGRPFKHPAPPDEEWHMETPEYPYPELPPPKEMLDVVSRWLARKSEPEIKQAIAALGVVAQEHRQAGREEQARMTEAHIPIMRSYLTKVLPIRIAQRKGGTTVQ